MNRPVVVYPAFLLLLAAVASSGAFFPPGDWYAGIAKPSWTPPNWLFGPVWTLLYVFIAVAGARVWLRVPAGERGRPFTPYFIQLALNALWSALFFGLHMPWVAFGELLLLAVFIVCTILSFRERDHVAAWLLVPYLAWVLFAGALNLAIAVLN
ncbi:MAG: TspO/MBR family protein [Gammaproteobacteria bacterium]|nr:TspO/MBR family protein [Gammaproteobacteria bacterium]